MQTQPPWYKDKILLTIVGVALLLRLAPMILYPQMDCVRDECIYRMISEKVINGQGLTTSNKGWLPAPGYPYLLAFLKVTTGYFYAVKWLQIGISLISTVWIFSITRRVFDQRTGRLAAALFAINPTMAWFTNTMWIETIYIFFLFGAILGLLRAREEGGNWALAGGASLGAAILFRGVATYLPPFFILAILYPDQPTSFGQWLASARKRWLVVVAFLLGAASIVAPYSAYQSSRQDGMLITDATIGHVLYLGNNDFEPLTFDYGNGMLTQPLFKGYLASGRPMCQRHPVKAVQSSKCEVKRTVEHIKEHPTEFVGRMPMRLAQFINPNSFLTRNVRWGQFGGFPWILKEALCVSIVLFSMMLTFLGTAGAWGRARGPYAMMAVGATIYTLATISVMYGMTRFRLPIEALWTVYLAVALASPRATWQGLVAQPWRMAGLIVCTPPLAYLTWWYLPTGFPAYW